MTVAGQRLGEFKRLVGAFSLDVVTEADATRFTYRCKYRPDIPATLAATEIVFLVNLLRRATRRRVVPQAVSLPGPLQAEAVFEDWFGCPGLCCTNAIEGFILRNQHDSWRA